MTSKLIVITLYSHDLSCADWIYFSENNDIVQQVTQGKLSDITSVAKESNIIVIVPAQDVLLTHVTLPKLSRQRLLQALPFALEEQLISDLDDLHFAVGEYQPDGSLPVAIIAKNTIQRWIDALKAVHIEPTAMIPATLAIPYIENNITLYTHQHIHIVRTGKFSGFTADDGSLDTMLVLQQKNNPLQTSIETLIDSHLQKNESNNWEKHFQQIARLLPSQPYINLLQKPYTAKHKMGRTKNVWRFVGYLAIAWIGLAFFNNLVSFFILHYQNNKLENEIETIYFHNFPQAKNLTAPRERMESKLKETVSATQKNNFLGLLATVGKSISQTHGIRLQNLDYRNGQLTLEISSATFDNLDNLTQDLNGHGLTVKQQNSTTTGSQVKATLLINAGTS